MRRIHYWMASQDPPPDILPTLAGPKKGLILPYNNDNYSWGKLNSAGRDARWEGLVALDELEDHRTPPPQLYLSRQASAPEARVHGGFWGVPLLPWPRCELDRCVAEQPVVVECWIEKSTMDDILLPICRRYDVSLQTGVGQIGLDPVPLLLERAEDDGRPHVVLYISDFDNQGENMPMAVARKIEKMRDMLSIATPIQLYPIALSKEQVWRYELPLIVSPDPKAPLIVSCRSLVEDAILRFRDPTLDERVAEVQRQAQAAVQAAEGQARDEHAQDLAQMQERFRALWREATELSLRMSLRMEELLPELPDVPEANEPEGLDEEPLYDSERSYLDQNDYYQARKRTDEDE